MRQVLWFFAAFVFGLILPVSALAQEVAERVPLGEVHELRSTDPRCPEGFRCFYVGGRVHYSSILARVNADIPDEARHVTPEQVDRANPCLVIYSRGVGEARVSARNGVCERINQTSARVTFREFCASDQRFCERWLVASSTVRSPVIYRVPAVRVLTPGERAEEMARRIDQATIAETIPAPAELGDQLTELANLMSMEQPPTYEQVRLVTGSMGRALVRAQSVAVTVPVSASGTAPTGTQTGNPATASHATPVSAANNRTQSAQEPRASSPAQTSPPPDVPNANAAAPDPSDTNNTLLWSIIIGLACLMLIALVFYSGRYYERRWGPGKLRERFQHLKTKVKELYEIKLLKLADCYNAELHQLNWDHSTELLQVRQALEAAATDVKRLTDELIAANLVVGTLQGDLLAAREQAKRVESNPPQLLVTGSDYFVELWKLVNEGDFTSEVGYARVHELLEKVIDAPARDALDTLFSTLYEHVDCTHAWRQATSETTAFTPDNIAALPQQFEQKYAEQRERENAPLRAEIQAEVEEKLSFNQEYEAELDAKQAELTAREASLKEETERAREELQGLEQDLAVRETAAAERVTAAEEKLGMLRGHVRVSAIHYDSQIEEIEEAVAELAAAHDLKSNEKYGEIQKLIMDFRSKSLREFGRVASDRPPPPPPESPSVEDEGLKPLAGEATQRGFVLVRPYDKDKELEAEQLGPKAFPEEELTAERPVTGNQPVQRTETKRPEADKHFTYAVPPPATLPLGIAPSKGSSSRPPPKV